MVDHKTKGVEKIQKEKGDSAKNPTKKPTKKKQKHFKAKRVGFTFSQCETSREDTLEALQKIYGDKLVRWLVAQETHSGGYGPVGAHHLHIFCEFTESIIHPVSTIAKAVGQHPNVQNLRSPASWIGYIIKEDQEFLCNFDPIEEGMAYSGKKDQLVLALYESGWSKSQIMARFKNKLWTENFMSWFRKIDEILELERLQDIEIRPGFKVKLTEKLAKDVLTPEEFKEFHSIPHLEVILKHLNLIFELGINQPPEQDHHVLLISGDTGVGKTRLLTRIEKVVPTYRFPLEHWHPRYQDGLFQLILWDEPKLRYAQLETYLMMFDGQPCDLPVKGSQVTRMDHQKIIMLSNRTLRGLLRGMLYRINLGVFKALQRRIEEVDVGDYPLHTLSTLIDRVYAEEIKKCNDRLLRRREQQSKRLEKKF